MGTLVATNNLSPHRRLIECRDSPFTGHLNRVFAFFLSPLQTLPPLPRLPTTNNALTN